MPENRLTVRVRLGASKLCVAYSYGTANVTTCLNFFSRLPPRRHAQLPVPVAQNRNSMPNVAPVQQRNS